MHQNIESLFQEDKDTRDRSDILKEYTKANSWQTAEIKGSIGVRSGKSKPKIEVLTANCKI